MLHSGQFAGLPLITTERFQMQEATKENKTRILFEINEIIGKHERFALFSHQEPDGDAIGSQAALSLALRRLGKKVLSLRSDSVPPSLAFLNRDKAITKYRPDRDREKIREAEVSVILDSCDYFRLGKLGRVVDQSPSLKINIDHHRDNAFFGDVNYVRFSAGGAAELVFEVIKSLGVPVTGTIAGALYVGLCTDTVGFRYIDPDGNMIGVIAELIRGGIDIEDLQEKIYCSRPPGYLDDLETILRRVKYENGGALAWFTMPPSEHLSFYERELANEVLKQLLCVKKIRAAAMLHHEESGVEVWLRSKTDVDVGRAAMSIGGGGHRTASGALLRGRKLEEAIETVLGSVRAEMK